MASREQLEDWVERWLQANRDAEAAGDWKPLADFYTDDATYGWNIGPKEDVMCVNKDEIRDVALGLEMEGLENWVYEYQKVLIDEKQNEIVLQVARLEPTTGTVVEAGVERWNDDGSADVLVATKMTSTTPDGKQPIETGSRWLATAVKEGQQWKISRLIQVI